MQFICDGLELSDAVMKVSKAIAIKTTNPLLEGIKIVAEENTLTLMATDLELSIQKTIKAEVKEEGATVVPGRFFSEYVKKLNGERIELFLNEKNGLTIKYGDSEGFIQCYSTKEYPNLNTLNTTNGFTITKTALKNLINRTIFSVAIDDSRPILKGCLFEIEENCVKTVTSDGYRLSLAKEKVSGNLNTSCIVPDKSLKEISKLLEDSDDEINVYIEKNFLMVDLDDAKITTRLLEGAFLNYKQIINASSYETVVTVKKNMFENALERASLLSRIGQNNLVKFEIADDTIRLTSNSEIGSIKEKVAISLQGKDLTIALRNVSDDFVKISLSNPTNPCVITSVEENQDECKYIFLILPVRLIN